MRNVTLEKKKNVLFMSRFTTHPSLAGAVLVLTSKRYTVFVCQSWSLRGVGSWKHIFFTIRFGNNDKHTYVNQYELLLDLWAWKNYLKYVWLQPCYCNWENNVSNTVQVLLNKIIGFINVCHGCRLVEYD